MVKLMEKVQTILFPIVYFNQWDYFNRLDCFNWWDYFNRLDCFNPCLTQSCRERSFLQHLVRACAAPNSSRGKIHTATVDRNCCLEYAQSSTVLSDKMEGEKVFTCDRCKYKTIYSWNLKRHILNIHENSPRRATIYNCSEGECWTYWNIRLLTIVSKYVKTRRKINRSSEYYKS